MFSKSRDNRARLLTFLFGIAFESIVAAGIVHFFGNDGSSFEQWGLLVGLFWVGSALLMLMWHIEAWIWFIIYGRKYTTDAVEAALKSEGLPVPPYIINSSDEYFQLIADNEDSPIDLRIKAAVYHAVVSSTSLPGGIMHGIRMRIAYEDAIKRL